MFMDTYGNNGVAYTLRNAHFVGSRAQDGGRRQEASPVSITVATYLFFY